VPAAAPPLEPNGWQRLARLSIHMAFLLTDGPMWSGSLRASGCSIKWKH
jgi:hypothetical protein